jgi:hypothetical protein
MILQLSPPIWVITPLGSGCALFIVDYSININSVWIVRLDADGNIKHFESNSIFVQANPMLGQPIIKSQK